MGREAMQALVAKMKGETIHAVIDSGTVVVLHPPNRARLPCEPANANQSQASGVAFPDPPNGVRARRRARARLPCEPANANQSQTSGVPSLTPQSCSYSS